MPPKTTKRLRSQLEPPSKQEYCSVKLKLKEAKAFFLSIQGCSFILERGFDPSASHCEEVWNLFMVEWLGSKKAVVS